MMQVKIILLFFVITFSQDWDHSFNGNESALLPHLYSGSIAFESTNPTTNEVNFNYSYNSTVTDGVFSASQNLYIATSFLDFVPGSSFVPGDRYIEVTEAKVSEDRTRFQIKIRNDNPNVDSVYSNPTAFEFLRMGFIIIGSDFAGSSSTLQSSYIYAKNDKLRSVDQTRATDFFDFAGNTQSPFDYLPDSDLGSGCGAVRKGGKMILQINGCQYYRFFVYLTGFQYQPHANFYDIGTTLTIKETNPSNDYEDYQHNRFFRSEIFKQSADDTQVGLILTYARREICVEELQASLVFVGIRSWSNSATDRYPSQPLLTEDTFVHFGSVSTSSDDENLLSGFPEEMQIFKNVNGKIAHAFCGLSKYVEYHAGPPPNLISRYIMSSTELKNEHTLLYEFIYPQFRTSIFYTCVLFGAKNVCQSNSRVMALSRSSDRITIESNLGINMMSEERVELTNDIFNSTIPEDSYNPTIKFRFDMDVGSNVVTIKIKYQRQNRIAFRGIIAFYPILFLQSGDSIKLNVFGKTIIDQTLSCPCSPFLQFNVYSTDQTQNTLEFMFTSSRSQSMPAEEYLEIGMLSYDKLMNEHTCVDACSDQPNYDIGFQFKALPICIYCDQTKNLMFHPTYFNCSCQTNFYIQQSSQKCERCQDPLCKTCQNINNVSICQVCVSNAENISSCKCKDGFFQSTSQIAFCQQCNVACDTCISLTSCTSCKQSNNTRETASRGCVCKTGFYDIGELVCPPCNEECLTCQESASNCLTCDQTKNYVRKGSTCICEDGYYMLRTDTDMRCEKCDPVCKKCEESAVKCIQCDQTDYRVLTGDNDCVCQDQYIELLGQCVDTTCQSLDPSCQSCALDSETSTKECLECSDKRMLVNGQCECKMGYFTVNDDCEKCGQGCTSCSVIDSKLRCFECAIDSIGQRDDGTCICPENTVLDEIAANLYCRPCSNRCKTCQKQFDFCTSCHPPSEIQQGGSCVCPDALYLSASGNCEQCMKNCELCTDAFSCDKCAPLYVWDIQQCVLNCPTGTYNNGQTCIDCPEGCEDCTNGYTCTSCKKDYVFFLDSCREDCPIGTFAIDGECFSCVPPCKTCFGPQFNECYSCEEGYVYFNNKCQTECDEGTYYIQGSCLPCDPICKDCMTISTLCTQCHEDKILYQNNCTDECPVAIVDEECTDICPDKMYLDGKQCKQCDDQCQTCIGTPTNCSRCSTERKSYKGQCLQNCPPNTLDQGTYCQQCHSQCDGCTGNTFNCSECAPGFIKLGFTCVKQCFEGQYIDQVTGECNFCGQGCKICTNERNCEQCKNSSHASLNGICQETCPSNMVLIDNECVCSFGVLFQANCVSNCPQSYYLEDRKCQRCLTPCRACIQGNNCLTCIEGYNLQQVNENRNQCIRQNQCPYGQNVSPTDDCENVCSEGLFLYKDKCISTCPVGYSKSDEGGCIFTGNPSLCPDDEYQQGTECVQTCSTGYYLDKRTKVCEKCIQNCLICVSKETCLTCSEGKVFIKGECIDEVGCLENQFQYKEECYDKCPIGTTTKGKSCVRSCKANTYFKKPFCFNDCPTPFRTLDACVEDCQNQRNCEPS